MKTIIAAVGLATAIVAIWGATVMWAGIPKLPDVAKAATSIDVMQMMKEAKGLQEEKFDSH